MAYDQGTLAVDPSSSRQGGYLVSPRTKSESSKGKGKASPGSIPSISVSGTLGEDRSHQQVSDWPFAARTTTQGTQTNSDDVHSLPSRPDPANHLKFGNTHHSRYNSIEILGIPRPSDPAKFEGQHPASSKTLRRRGSFPSLIADEMVAGPARLSKRERRQIVVHDKLTGKLYQCHNLVEIRNGHRKPKDQAGLTVPTLQIQNSDGTFTVLDPASSSTDTVITRFPSTGFDRAAFVSRGADRGSHPQPVAGPMCLVRQWRGFVDLFRHPKNRAIIAVLLLIVGLLSFSASCATAINMHLDGQVINAGIMAWLAMSTVFLGGGVIMAIIVYLDHRHGRLASDNEEELYELEVRRDGDMSRGGVVFEELEETPQHGSVRGTQTGSADQSDQRGDGSVDDHSGLQHHRVQLNGRDPNFETGKGKLKQQEIMLHAIEQASSHIAMPATSLPESHIHLSPMSAKDSSFASTITPTKTIRTPRNTDGINGGPSSQSRFLSPSGTTNSSLGASSSKSSILTELCAAVTESYSPLEATYAHKCHHGAKEEEIR